MHSESLTCKLTHCSLAELEALELEAEEEGASYLADLNKVPDFVDEAPVETDQVCEALLFLSTC